MIRRGEGGGVDGWWAFMVARIGMKLSFMWRNGPGIRKGCPYISKC